MFANNRFSPSRNPPLTVSASDPSPSRHRCSPPRVASTSDPHPKPPPASAASPCCLHLQRRSSPPDPPAASPLDPSVFHSAASQSTSNERYRPPKTSPTLMASPCCLHL
ncbi:hypothetical protein GUJ93_ZPchr0013g37047 [Zizania palustris]|uniref:Uncharacterized protein n=1 Tax=Zizania palustris TaxID=103762 RepID=A0A8J5X1X8_ZIZPA|nr:hypothetical protein GUJ93_ZPchr0013g37047 [Zizania palustris]